MINPVRNLYLVKTNEYKANNQPLNANDYLNIGYMAGRSGINLSNNPSEPNPLYHTNNGTIVNINSCTSNLFEQNLNQAGIKFDKLV